MTNARNHPARIAGIGIVSAYGWGREVFFDGLTSMKTAVQPFALPGSRPGETFLIGRIPDGGDADDAPTRSGRALFAAAREAVGDAIAAGWSPGRRLFSLRRFPIGRCSHSLAQRILYLRQNSECHLPGRPAHTLGASSGRAGRSS